MNKFFFALLAILLLDVTIPKSWMFVKSVLGTAKIIAGMGLVLDMYSTRFRKWKDKKNHNKNNLH